MVARLLVVESNFYSRPCGRGDAERELRLRDLRDFYSRPCGRGDAAVLIVADVLVAISTHAPAGGATESIQNGYAPRTFLLTPLREGRRSP